MNSLLSDSKKIKKINLIFLLIIVVQLIISMFPYLVFSVKLGGEVVNSKSWCYVAPTFVVQNFSVSVAQEGVSKTVISTLDKTMDGLTLTTRMLDGVELLGALNIVFVATIGATLFIYTAMTVVLSDYLNRKILMCPYPILVMSLLQLFLIAGLTGDFRNNEGGLVNIGIQPTVGLIINILISLLLCGFGLYANKKIKSLQYIN